MAASLSNTNSHGNSLSYFIIWCIPAAVIQTIAVPSTGGVDTDPVNYGAVEKIKLGAEQLQ